MKNNSFAHGQELPLGLSMALAQVPAAYAYFAKLDPLQRQQIIDSAHCIRSKEEMRGAGHESHHRPLFSGRGCHCRSGCRHPLSAKMSS